MVSDSVRSRLARDLSGMLAPSPAVPKRVRVLRRGNDGANSESDECRAFLALHDLRARRKRAVRRAARSLLAALDEEEASVEDVVARANAHFAEVSLSHGRCVVPFVSDRLEVYMVRASSIEDF